VDRTRTERLIALLHAQRSEAARRSGEVRGTPSWSESSDRLDELNDQIMHVGAFGSWTREIVGRGLELDLDCRPADDVPFRRHVVDSIRNPAEVQTLRQVPGFVLVGVDAAARVRFARSRLRARAGDPESFEDFEARERQENSSNPAGQQLRATFALADRVVHNDGDLDALHVKVDALLAALDAPVQER
jgi:hypothetical protein